ncbi:hypothetical protein [Adhaeribacter aquaticus]|uniref:hypothetical protein n=1 Tax=Adhaeribacter aquaticus TaxID=299567 RepID=UPI0004184256|nr:hypothetical protein [Adhaeribacter aquaticus]
MAFLPILILALVHLNVGKLRFLGGTPRSIWLSAAGGVSVSYIFLHLFPEFQEGQEQVEKAIPALFFLEHHIYLLALFGLVFFYGLERFVINSKSRKPELEEEKKAGYGSGIFWVHIGSFAIYNALIGYTLFLEEKGQVRDLILFSLAMALHFIVNDYGLQEKHQNTYDKKGRWVLVLSLTLGWSIGFFWKVPEEVLMMILAFIGGGVILNVMKEELPEERESRFWAFLLGSACYAGLLLTLR